MTATHPPTRRRSLALACVVTLHVLASTVLAAVSITEDRTLAAGDSSLDGQHLVVSQATLTVAGNHSFASITLQEGAVLTHPAAPAGEPGNALRLQVSGDVLVDATSRIDVSGRGGATSGYPGAGGRAGYSGGGGGHGGHGHVGAGNPGGTGGRAFGSITDPDTWGGPGGPGNDGVFAPGGGLIRLVVGGTFTVEGAVIADGAPGTANNQGGGAGGGIFVQAGTMRGAGRISANGAPGEWVDGGGGAGGRIAVRSTRDEFTGEITARGGGGAGVGGAGTLYRAAGGDPGVLLVRNEFRGEWTPITSPVAFDLTLAGAAIAYPTEPIALRNLSLLDSAMLTHPNGSTGVVVRATGNVTIAAAAGIDTNGRGYPFDGNRGPGTGGRDDWSGSGAGHGGLGGHGVVRNSVGAHYGSPLHPVLLGSQGGDSNGGPGSAGGGAIRLIVDGTLDVAGRITANGLDNPVNNAGGGSGGSIWITASRLTGGGTIHARGGAGEWVDGGGGSGGRIALELSSDTFTGSLTTSGGGGAERGGAGTVYRRIGEDRVGTLVVDNGGNWGNYTPLTSPVPFRLTLSGRAVAYQEAPLEVASLDMPDEAYLTHLTGQSNVFLRVLGDATIGTNSQLNVDGRGYPIDTDRGPGAGARETWAGSGGGHGGLGGNSASGAIGGQHYGSMLEPVALGSAGGNADGGPGTAGGGAVRLIVEGRLSVHGRLSADGAGNPPNNAGGGAGGSIYLTVGTLSGAGSISVNGGPGEWVDGGGGAGGRIALYCQANEFTGPITAYGGGGHQKGGAGTFYVRLANSPRGQLLVSNGGTWGQYTPLTSPEAFDLTLEQRATAYGVTPLTVHNLDIKADANLTHLPGLARCEVTALNNITIQSGGTINTDGRGYPAGDDRGPGAGVLLDWAGSGAGHGARGGRSVTGAEGGAVYGSIVEPLTPGSQGGNGNGGPGGAGGGVIRLIAANTITIDGFVTASGLNGVPNNAGGGSGGSIYLTAASLAGSGTLAANGGAGEWVDGGGGSGGRIALHVGQQNFKGTLEARGLGGSAIGGAGTLYTRLAGETGGALVLENSGNNGALSPLEVPPNTRLVLSGGSTVHAPADLHLVSLHLRPGATITHTNGQPRLQITIDEDFTIDAGATITASGRGYPVGADAGPGAGESGGGSGGGGAHGGNGGVAWPGDVLGGGAYGSVLKPVDYGSSGGPGYPGGARSPGGGAIRIEVNGALTVNGSVEANGVSAWYNNQGGAAGGSVWITASRLAGTGSITADGGTGEWVDGGAGSGGRIALYTGTNEFTGRLQARGGPSGRQPGAAGTVYTKLTSEPVGRVLVENGDVRGALTPLVAEERFHLTLRGKAAGYPADVLRVASLNLAPETLLTHLVGQPGCRVVVSGDALIAGSVNVDGLGYPWASNPGPGAGSQRDWSGSGAGHGGQGGRSATQQPGGQSYGSALEPSEPGSQGGSGSGGPGGAGGGVVRLVIGGTLTVEGAISANALNGVANNAGGGAGGSIFLTARELAGAGSITANGGAGEWVDGGGGAGGRIALYRTRHAFSGAITALGAGGAAPGEEGTIHQDSTPALVWLAPSEGWLHGSVNLEAAVFTDGTESGSVTFSVVQDETLLPLGSTPLDLAVSLPWDTTQLADGRYEIRAVARNASGRILAESRRSVDINNSVTWHQGVLIASETWEAGKVHAIHRDLTIPAGVTLNIAPGAVVKVLPGVRVILMGGGTLLGLGTAAQPAIVTSFLDDTVGGDSNLDGDLTRPTPGAWRLVVNASAEFAPGDNTQVRYYSRTYGGSLSGSETWTSGTLREITETLVVPPGATLRLEAGTVLKFAPGQGLDVRSGATLIATGNAADPVVLTSIRDDARGGDTNGDGTQTAPAAGDWRSVRLEDGGTATLDHVVIRYGGNSVGNPWGAGGAIEALGGPLTVRNSVIADALKDGAFCYGNTRFENCLILRCDRGLTAVGQMEVIHCTVDECRIGLLEHVGQLIARNTIVSRSIDVGISHDLGGHSPIVAYCNVWNPGATQGNYTGTTDRTGTEGNISAEPRYKDADADNFRLTFGSPGIDAANGTWSSATDAVGAPRYDDPRTGNTGVAIASGAVPDIGALEFVESAPSNIDLVVAGISGPARIQAGETVHLEWLLVNRGTQPFTGPWHDAILLQNAATGIRIPVAEALVGREVTVGPGQSHTASADIRVPGGVSGDYTWTIVANSRGDVYEGANAANNESGAAASSTLDVPELTLNGAAVQGSFAAQEQAHWFRCRAPAGTDVRFALDLNGTAGITEVYVGRGFMPDPGSFTARQREFGSADSSAVAAAASDSDTDLYVLVIGRVLPTVPETFTLKAESAAFSLESVLPLKVGNRGPVTLQIHGSGLSEGTAYVLRLGGERRVATRISQRESGRVFATFDLEGLATGAADVLAEAGGLAVTLPGAVEVIDGGAPEFYAELQGPATTRAGRLTPWFVTYGNRGTLDMPVPLLRLSAPGATEIQLYESTLNWADSFHFLGIHPDVLLPTLGPGQEVTFQVRLKVANPTEVRIDLVPGSEFVASPEPFNWSSLAAPAGVDAARWNQWLSTLNARVGTTVANYAARLEQDLDSLRTSPLRYAYVANIDGRWLFGGEGDDYGTPNPIIEIPPEEEDPAMPSLHAPPAKLPGDGIRKTWWVIITVEDYANRRRPDGTGAKDLRGTRVDFNDLYDYTRLELRVPEEQIAGAHDAPNDGAAWTRDNILSELEAFKGKADGDDNLVIVFSGHGGITRNGTGYLCGNGGSISPVAFTRAVEAVGAGTTYFINDSCHSEAFNEAVTPANSTFVGMAGSMRNRTSRDTAHGGELISNLKGQLRRCRSLGRSFELTEAHVSRKYENEPLEKRRQHPVLTNPTNASLEGKPWNDPSGFEQELRRAFLRLAAHPYTRRALSIVGSVDPNDKYALAGFGPEHWVQPGQTLPFEVVFENKTNAAAPAQEVLVIDDLDASLDWSTFELKSIAFNDARITVPPGLQHYTTTASVGTDPNEVTVDVGFNPATGRITWLMRSRDPLTGDLPEDPYAGFLPPNDVTRRGEGSLSYTIRPKPGLVDGTQITNRATIIFDPTYGANPPILTPWVTNTIDGLPPSSQASAPASQPTGEFTVQWSGDDAPGGSGIASYDVYVARDDGAYQAWQIATTATSAPFTGQPGSTYRFYSIARDAAGNTESAPATPDATVTLAGGSSFATWAATQGMPPGASGPDDDPDGDGIRNFAEYALALSPVHPDARLAAPVPGIAEVAGQRYLALTYRRPRNEPGDVRYRITTSQTLVPWSGSTTSIVVGTIDRGTHVEVTVRSVAPVSSGAAGFLKLEIVR